MKKLTKEQAVAEHRKMWNWIADQLEKNGVEYIFSVVELKKKYCNKNDFDIMNNCFCCEYDRQQKARYYCENCPILWGSEGIRGDYYCESGIIDKKTDEHYGEEVGLWLMAENLSMERKYKEAAEVARQIANLPERPEEKTED